MIFSHELDYATITQAIGNGAAGYLIKSMEAPDVIASIKAAVSGQTVFSPEVVRLLAEPAPIATLPKPLTERELAVLKRVAQGDTNKV